MSLGVSSFSGRSTLFNYLNTVFSSCSRYRFAVKEKKKHVEYVQVNSWILATCWWQFDYGIEFKKQLNLKYRTPHSTKIVHFKTQFYLICLFFFLLLFLFSALFAFSFEFGCDNNGSHFELAVCHCSFIVCCCSSKSSPRL